MKIYSTKVHLWNDNGLCKACRSAPVTPLLNLKSKPGAFAGTLICTRRSYLLPIIKNHNFNSFRLITILSLQLPSTNISDNRIADHATIPYIALFKVSHRASLRRHSSWHIIDPQDVEFLTLFLSIGSTIPPDHSQDRRRQLVHSFQPLHLEVHAIMLPEFCYVPAELQIFK